MILVGELVGELAPLLASAAVVMALLAVRWASDPAVLERLGRPARTEHASISGALLRRVGRTSLARRVPGRDRLQRVLALADAGIGLEEVLAAKLLAAAASFVVLAVAPPPGLLVAPFVAVSAFRAPDLVLAGRARRRRQRADREIPLLLDLLAAGSSAGLSGHLALVRAATVIRGPLREELDRALFAIELGARWRDELRALAERLELPDLRRAVSTLARTDSLGTPLAEQMSALAAQVRDARRAAVAERARKAPVKMLFPLVFLVLPAFLLLTVVPVLLTTLRSIG